MTAIRKSIVFAPESTFGGGDSSLDDNKFCHFPPGTFISHTGARQAQSIYTTGSKKRAGAVYGNFTGSWNISFPFSYDYLEPILMMFEQIDSTYDDTNDNTFDPIFGATGLGNDKPAGSTLRYFKKVNNARVQPFVFREKILNHIAGGPSGSDETTLLKGCVAKSINVTRSASGSQMNVEISGVYADQETTLGTLSATDYDPDANTDLLAQYSCMFMDGITDADYVGDVDSHSFSVDNNTSLVYNTCTPIAQTYYEGQTNYSWNAQTYSNDPAHKFKLRPNSGGVKVTASPYYASKPWGKGLLPMSFATFATYSASRRDTTPSLASYKAAITASEYSFVASAKNSTVKSMTWQKGDGSKMMDSLSSVECDEIWLRIVNKTSGGAGAAAVNLWTTHLIA